MSLGTCSPRFIPRSESDDFGPRTPSVDSPNRKCLRALPHGAVADALATVRASQAVVTTKDAFELLVLTAARSGEVRLATWDEMDLDAGVWTIPAARMKAKRDHRVPLSARALAILHDARRRSDGTGLVFRSLRGKPLSDMTLSNLIKELGIAAGPHGFRSSFRDWAAERTSTPPTRSPGTRRTTESGSPGKWCPRSPTPDVHRPRTSKALARWATPRSLCRRGTRTPAPSGAAPNARGTLARSRNALRAPRACEGSPPLTEPLPVGATGVKDIPPSPQALPH